MLVLFLSCFCCVLIRDSSAQLPPERFRVIKEWKYINFTWPDFESQRMALTKGEYIPHNVLMAGINYYKDYYYLAIPRMKFGIPITLGRIHVNSSSKALIEPFPSWELNKLDDCDALQNVQNVAVDSNAKMWIIDGGKTNTLNRSPSVKCNPKLVIYDMESNTVEMVHTFPQEVANKEISFLYDIIVDGDFAYISDNSRVDPGLIVYSKSQDKSWKIKHDTMKADPSAIEFTVANTRVSTPISIAGLALSPKIHQSEKGITINDDRVLFFCPMSSTNLYSVKTHYLKDQKYNVNGNFSGVIVTVGNKGGQTDGMKMDNKGILYFGVLPSSSIIQWDSSTPFVSNQKIIARDQQYIQWPNSFAFDDSGNIVVLTNGLQKYIQGRMNIEESNFRILKAYVNGKSYVYEDDTLSYMINEHASSNNSEVRPTLTTIGSMTMVSTTEKAPEKSDSNTSTTEDVTITKVMSSAGTLKVFAFYITFGLTLNLLL